MHIHCLSLGVATRVIIPDVREGNDYKNVMKQARPLSRKEEKEVNNKKPRVEIANKQLRLCTKCC